MAPTKTPQAPYAKDERVLCFHHEMLYEAKVLDVRLAEDSMSWECKIHYKGWKATWDDWVPSDRVRKFTDENKALAQQLQEQMKALQQAKAAPAKSAKAKKGQNGSDFSSARASEERGSAAVLSAQQGRTARRMKEYDLEQEADHNARPKIRIVLPDHIKSVLVDDWENISKHCQLVPIPARVTVDQILKEYFEDESKKRTPGTAEWNLLEETVAGLREYFSLCVGRILLYRFEREQYDDARKNWESENFNPSISGKDALSTYGAEHLCRLMSHLPELVAQTNMDQQSVNRLREELNKLTDWIAVPKNFERLFAKEYETPHQSYIERASRG